MSYGRVYVYDKDVGSRHSKNTQVDGLFLLNRHWFESVPILKPLFFLEPFTQRDV